MAGFTTDCKFYFLRVRCNSWMVVELVFLLQMAQVLAVPLYFWRYNYGLRKFMFSGCEYIRLCTGWIGPALRTLNLSQWCIARNGWLLVSGWLFSIKQQSQVPRSRCLTAEQGWGGWGGGWIPSHCTCFSSPPNVKVIGEYIRTRAEKSDFWKSISKADAEGALSLYLTCA